MHLISSCSSLYSPQQSALNLCYRSIHQSICLTTFFVVFEIPMYFREKSVLSGTDFFVCRTLYLLFELSYVIFFFYQNVFLKRFLVICHKTTFPQEIFKLPSFEPPSPRYQKFSTKNDYVSILLNMCFAIFHTSNSFLRYMGGVGVLADSCILCIHI